MNKKEWMEIQLSLEQEIPACSWWCHGVVIRNSAGAIPPQHNTVQMNSHSTLSQAGKGEWELMPSHPCWVRCQWGNPLLSGSTQSTEAGPPWLVGGRRSGKRQMRISKGIEGMQFLLTVLKTLAGRWSISLWENLTWQSPHRAHEQPNTLSTKLTPSLTLQQLLAYTSQVRWQV